MTLILAYVNAEFVVMAADRRITVGRAVQDDRRTKMMLWQNDVLVGFTGLAEVGPARTHTMEWLADTVAAHPEFNTNLIVRDLASAVDAAPFARKYKRLALVCVGFTDDQPFYALITNMHSDDGVPLSAPRRDWRVRVDRPSRPDVRAVGAAVPDRAGRDLMERLRRTHCVRLPSPRTVSQILAGGIEASAGAYVSDTGLITVFPRGPVAATVDVVGPSARRGEKADLAFPYFVGHGFVMVLPPQYARRAR